MSVRSGHSASPTYESNKRNRKHGTDKDSLPVPCFSMTSIFNFCIYCLLIKSLSDLMMQADINKKIH